MTFGKTHRHRDHLLATALLITICWLGPAPAFPANGQEANDAARSRILSALTTIRHSLPAPPSGWIVQEETSIDRGAQAAVASAAAPVIQYRIRYKRQSGLRDDQRRLDEAYGESSRRNYDAANPQIDELIKQQTVVSNALRKAVRRRNEAEQKRLNDELDENGRKMRALHEEVDRRISRDVEPFLIRDAEAEIVVGLNEDAAETGADASAFERKPAVFAVRTAGERAGITRWKEGGMVLLFGPWQRAGATRFRALVSRELPGGRVQTLRISITGDQKRAEQLLQGIDLAALLSLMEAR